MYFNYFSDDVINEIVVGFCRATIFANTQCSAEHCEDGREKGECEHTDLEYGDFDPYSDDEITIGQLNDLEASIREFVERNAIDTFKFFILMDSEYKSDPAQLYGQALCLNASGHGAGFHDYGSESFLWDLKNAANSFGSWHVESDDDGFKFVY